MKNNLKTRREIVKQIWLIRGENGAKLSWDKVAEYFGVSKPCVYRLAKEKDYNPGPENSRILGMQYYAPAPVCAVHGVVHCYDCQTQDVKQKRNGRSPRARQQYTVSVGYVEDPETRAKLKAIPPAERLRRILGMED